MVRKIVLAALVLLAAMPGHAKAEVTVFVPGGLAPAFEEIAQSAETRGIGLKVVSGHSPAQARQIEEGANADIFVSADPQWLDFLAARHLSVEGRRAVLARTRLILIAPARSSLAYGGKPGESLSAALGADGKLAMGDPDMLPAGRFAKDALVRLGAWDDLQGHLAFFHHVGMVAAMVERGEAAAGIAFASDLNHDPKIRIVAEFSDQTAPPVDFPMTVIAGHDRAETLQAFEFLAGAEAAAILESHGFTAAK